MRLAMALIRIVAEADEGYFLDAVGRPQKGHDFFEGDPYSSVHRKAVDAGADRRKSDRRQAVHLGKSERIAITIRKQFILAVAAAVPNRANGVDYVLRRQLVALG